MPAPRPSWRNARDLLFVIGVAAFVTGLGAVTTSFSPPDSPAEPIRTAVTMAPELESADPSGRATGTTAAASSSPMQQPAANQGPHPAGIAEPGERRDYILEMAARLRHTTLGSTQKTREAVDQDIYAYQWLGVVENQPRAPATPARATLHRPQRAEPGD